jgi:hypothetical protein
VPRSLTASWHRSPRSSSSSARPSPIWSGKASCDLGEREGLGDGNREAPSLDQLADIGDRAARATDVSSAERHPRTPARQRSRRSFTTCSGPPARSMRSGNTPLPGMSSARSTPAGASTRTRSMRPRTSGAAGLCLMLRRPVEPADIRSGLVSRRRGGFLGATADAGHRGHGQHGYPDGCVAALGRLADLFLDRDRVP